jgi:autotransporter-associated beta strand protein
LARPVLAATTDLFTFDANGSAQAIGDDWQNSGYWEAGKGVPDATYVALFQQSSNGFVQLNGDRTVYGLMLMSASNNTTVRSSATTTDLSTNRLTLVSTFNPAAAGGYFNPATASDLPAIYVGAAATLTTGSKLSVNAPIVLGNASTSASETQWATFDLANNIASAMTFNGSTVPVVSEYSGTTWGLRLIGPNNASNNLGAGTSANAIPGSINFQLQNNSGVGNAYNGIQWNVHGGIIIEDGTRLAVRGNNSSASGNNMLPHGVGYGNVTLNGYSRMATTNGGVQTINGLNSTSATANVDLAKDLVIGDADANGDFAGTVTGTSSSGANVTKIGGGTQILRGNNTYVGTTRIGDASTLSNVFSTSGASSFYTNTTDRQGGKLVIAGTTGTLSAATPGGQGSYTVTGFEDFTTSDATPLNITGGSATLAGSGFIGLANNATITLAGSANKRAYLSPSDEGTSTSTGIGTLRVGWAVSSGGSRSVTNKVIFGANSVLAIDIGAVGVSDQLALDASSIASQAGYLDLSGTSDTLQLNALGGSFDGSTYTIATFAGFVNPGVANVFDTVTGLPDGYLLSYTSGSIVLTQNPEPASTALMGVVASGLCLRRRRRCIQQLGNFN